MKSLKCTVVNCNVLAHWVKYNELNIHIKNHKYQLEHTGRGKGKLGRSETVAWSYIYNQM